MDGTALALSAVLLLVTLGGGFYVLITGRYREAEPGWRAAARQLGGEVIRTPGSLSLVCVVDGRPVRIATIRRGRGRLARTFTTIGAAIRHPDHVLAGASPPAATASGWTEAWQDARAAARGRASDRRLPDSPVATRHLDGVVGDAETLIAELVRHLATVRSREDRVHGWRAAAAALGLESAAAYHITGRWDGRPVTITADLLARTVAIRSAGGAHGDAATIAIAAASPPGFHHLERLDDLLPGELALFAADPAAGRARLVPGLPALASAAPTAVIADGHGATVSLSGLAPSVERWRAALALTTALA